MKIWIKKEVEVEAKVLKIYSKIRDQFTGYIVDQDDQQIGKDHDGYVPDFMPGNHYGDYLILNIDLDTGQVLNWTPPSKQQIEAFIGGEEEEY